MGQELLQELSQLELSQVQQLGLSQIQQLGLSQVQQLGHLQLGQLAIQLDPHCTGNESQKQFAIQNQPQYPM